MSDALINNALRKTPIAIIGMGSVFPGARNLQEYWDNIVKEVDSITEVPPSRWEIDDYYDPDPLAPDKTYCKRGGFLPDIDFNPMEYGLPPNILEVTDASQLLSLVVAKQAMIDAGYGDMSDDMRDRTGCILGVGGGQKLITPLVSRLQYPVWDRVLESSGVAEEDRAVLIDKMKKAYIPWEENSFPGMLGNVIAGRICNRLDLGGTNCVVDAACAASLAAVKMAVSELIEGSAETMITGGVDTDNSIFMYMSFSKTPAFSRANDIRPFDENSDGMMIGEGVGMVVLKRLADAERDGDRIYAVIKGIGTSSDGRYKSIYAPRASGQAKAVVRAYEAAGYKPETVSLVEAHGTGTPAGDPTEFEGLNEVFSYQNPRKQHVAIGSVKSQIGHTKAAAGAASLIKTALALHHKILPPTLKVDKPNPKMDIENSAFYVNSNTRPWIKPSAHPRRASVSAFGFGGTNFHFALEEYTPEHTGQYRLQTVPQTVVLAAATPDALLKQCNHLVASLQNDVMAGFAALKAASVTKVAQGEARIGFVADSAENALVTLLSATALLKKNLAADGWEHPKGIYYRRSGIDARGKVVALFPGQGSQYLEMGRGLAQNFAAVREGFAHVDAAQKKLTAKTPRRQEEKSGVSEIVFPIPTFAEEDREAQEVAIRDTQFAQPAIGALSYGMMQVLRGAGFSADFAAGHSFGELTALWAGGVLDDAAFFHLINARGQAMAAPTDPSFDAGAMLAVKGDIAQLQNEIRAFNGVTIANHNSDTQVVLAGSKAAIANAETVLKSKGYKATALPVSAAFHTSFVGHAQQPFAQEIVKTRFAAPRIPVFSNSTGQAHNGNPQLIQQVLQQHILQPVLFKQEIENIYAAGGSIFVEVGPKRVLTNLVKDILGSRPHVAVAVNASSNKDSDWQLRDAFVQLVVMGLQLDALDPHQADATLVPVKQSPINVQLGGHNYVSPKTQAAYTAALSDGHQLQVDNKLNGVQPVAAPVPAMAKVAVATNAAVATKATVIADKPTPPALKSTVKTNGVKPASPAVPKIAKPSTPTQIQKPTVAVTRKPASNPVAAPKAAVPSAAIQKQSPRPSSTMTHSQNTLEKALDLLHQHQAETLRVHEAYLRTQEQFTSSVVSLLQGGNAPSAPPVARSNGSTNGVAPAVVAPPAPVARNGNGTANGVKESEVVFRPKPAPAPVAPPPAAPRVAAKERRSEEAKVVAPVKAKAQIVSQPVATPAATPSSDLSDAMLAVVSEKTGYPVEMLELSMDMESDLGIDSIKRVEILGAMQDNHPELPEVNPTELAELRTLQEIVDHMGGAEAELTAKEPRSQEAKADVSSGTTSQVNGQHATRNTLRPAQGEAQQFDVSALSDAMLAVVSEKTGYPVEMLELDMDMESDLGIDSIKRVEILGAMQDNHPELPAVNPTELAELRTLREIVEHLGGAEDLTAKSPSRQEETSAAVSPAPSTNGTHATRNTQPAFDVSALSDAMLEVVSEKTGYPVEMLELDMDMESDLGIDSIKRVEILGAMQDNHPELPAVNPTELAELRTLREIVDHLGGAPVALAGTEKKADAAIAGAATSQSVSVPAPTGHTITRNVVALKTLPMPDFLEVAQPDGFVCLVTNDGTERTEFVARAIEARGWTVERIGFSAEFNETQLQAQLDTFPNVNAFVHLGFGDAESDARVKQVFFAAKHLKQRLGIAAAVTRPAFITATALDGALGLDGSFGFDPIRGGYFGLVKTLRLEWPDVYCRAIDLHPGIEPADAAQYVVAELFDPNKLISEVGYGNQGRVTLVTEEVNQTQYTQTAQITRESVFVVSGGAKGITAQCVLHLAKQYQCKFVLLGRSAIDAVDDSWLDDFANEADLKKQVMQRLIAQGEKPTPMAVNKIARGIQSQREISGTLIAIEMVGGAAEYVSVNVTDSAEVVAKLTAAQKSLGNVTGIIHGAGVLSDKLIEKKTENDFDRVYDTKIKGLQALLSAVPIGQLEQLVLFSSAAGFYGNTGQSDYAVANDILNKWAHLVKVQHPNCNAVAIDWGPWDGGMVTPVLKKLFAERNISVIPVEVGAWMMANEMTDDNAQVAQTVVGGELMPSEPISDLAPRKHRIHRQLQVEANPFLQDHVIGGNPVLPTVNAIAWMGNLCEQLYPGYTLFACDNYQVLKGIVFDEGNEHKDCLLTLEEVEKSADSIRIKAMISSQTADGKPRFHYRAELTLLHQLPDAPVYDKVDLVEGTTMTPKDIYGSSIFHGPLFWGVEQVINITPQKVTMRCNLPALTDAQQGQFPLQTFNPYIADPQYQSMVIWARHFHDAGSLPLMTERGEQFRPIPFDAVSYTTMEVTSSSDSKLVANLITHDENGVVYSCVTGATVTISQALNDLFVPFIKQPDAEAKALLHVIHQSQQSIRAGKSTPHDEVMANMKKLLDDSKDKRSS